MNSKRIQFVLAGVAAWISLLLMITTTYGGSIVIGGNYTDVGTIVIINPNPADPTGNGTALLNNLADIPAGVNNPYLIKLAPGIYNIGTDSLQMKPYLDIEGSGENTTTITGHIDGLNSGVVQGASNAEIRFLTVRNTGGGTNVAIYNTSASPKITNVTTIASGGTWNLGIHNYVSSSPTMTNVTVSASGGSGSTNYGVWNYSFSLSKMTNVRADTSGGSSSSNVGVHNTGSSPTMTNVTVSASGGSGSTNYGVENFGDSGSYGVTMTNVTASASGGTESRGVYNDGGASVTMTNVTASASGAGGTLNYGVYSSGIGTTTRINHSVIKGTSHTVYTTTGTMTLLGNTQLDGGSVSAAGTLNCAGVYDETYTFYATACP